MSRRRRIAQSLGADGHAEKRQEIISAAAKIFKEKGYEVATLNEVAERSNNDRATLVSKAVFGMLNWTHRWFKPGGGLSGEQIAEHFSRLLLRGLDTTDK